MSSLENTHVLKVVQTNQLAPQIIQLLLKPEHPIQYTSGDYIMLGFDTEELKPFSIADAPREDGLIECHIRNQLNNDWMEKLCSVSAGDTLVMQGPKAQMSLHPAHEAIIFVAGGTGFAPMRALLVEALRQHVAVPITFYWGARSPDELYMHEWMVDLVQKHGNIDYIPVISDNTEGWQGQTGLVHNTVLKDHPSLDKTTLYMCGPWPMIQTAKEAFLAVGLHENKLIH
ncbi:FAD-binding oxidoreductase [Thiomicrorhabdus sp. Kp2]|uniref:FAD-binding oxidoreductase n=1 Tax=Thiomicrorhabdus sp. Kp2 TaxID=1123518 RepID=UPI000416188D|nr:FAD-binding oxidoreductase [Thiomicrorhabdus sp. Kp2]